MIFLVREFCNALKQEGLMVPTPSLNFALEAVSHIDPLSPLQFRSALEAALVQRAAERELFEQVFHRFFIEQQPLVYATENQLFKANLKDFTQEIKKEGTAVNHILADYLEGDARALLEELYIEGVEPDQPVPLEEFKEQKKAASKLNSRKREQLRNRVKVLIELAEDFSARSFHLQREKREKLADYLRQRLLEALEMLEKQSQPKGRRNLMPWEKKRTLSTLSFAQLTEREAQRVKEEVEVLAHKLQDSLSRKRRKANQGHMDIKKTLREATPYGGIPFQLHWKKPAKTKGKIVALCDISSSVSYAAQFMVLLLYKLQNRFSKIRTFVFVRQSYEITRFFESYPLEQAMLRALKEYKIGMGQPSNYGLSFQSFRAKWEQILTPDTTLLILGDGQNNFNEPQVEHFEALTKKAARTIWLNPEEEKFWYSASNSIRHYQPFCDELVECATLDQLTEFTRSLVL